MDEFTIIVEFSVVSVAVNVVWFSAITDEFIIVVEVCVVLIVVNVVWFPVITLIVELSVVSVVGDVVVCGTFNVSSVDSVSLASKAVVMGMLSDDELG